MKIKPSWELVGDVALLLLVFILLWAFAVMMRS